MTISELVKADETKQSQDVVTPESSTTTVTPDGDLQNQVAPEAVVTTPEGEENVSTFTIPEFTESTSTVVAEQTETTTVTPSTNWQDIVKTVDKKELAKAAGISDFALELNEYINSGGDASDYIAAKGIDWNKVPDADLIIDELRKEYPDANNQQLQRLFNKKYNQTELADDEDREDGELLMKADARKVRQSRIEYQQKFKMPEQVKQQESLDLEKIKLEAEQAQMAEFEKVKSFYDNHEATKNLINSKRVAVKLGEKGSFNFNIDKPEVLMQMLLDGKTWQAVTSNKQGEPDVEKLQEIALHAANPNYNMDLVNYGIALGKKMMVEEGQNAKRPIGSMPSDGVSKGLVIKGTGTLKQHMAN